MRFYLYCWLPLLSLLKIAVWTSLDDVLCFVPLEWMWGYVFISFNQQLSYHVSCRGEHVLHKQVALLLLTFTSIHSFAIDTCVENFLAVFFLLVRDNRVRLKSLFKHISKSFVVIIEKIVFCVRPRCSAVQMSFFTVVCSSMKCSYHYTWNREIIVNSQKLVKRRWRHSLRRIALAIISYCIYLLKDLRLFILTLLLLITWPLWIYIMAVCYGRFLHNLFALPYHKMIMTCWRSVLYQKTLKFLHICFGKYLSLDVHGLKWPVSQNMV